MKKSLFILLIPLFLFGMAACHQPRPSTQQTQMLFRSGHYPHAFFWNGTYYYTMQPDGNDITLYATRDLSLLPQSQHKVVWSADSLGFQHFWSPEIHRINGRWYIYFEADDGNTDNHQLYVIENTGDDPMQGTWQLRGPLQTNEDWNFGIHPNVLSVGGELYLFWSGWPKRRVEHETQCIYIARLSDPWTVASERVMLSRPEYEWERQWINPDGSRSAYPIYVNENPQALLSPDGRHVHLYYSASGIWTRYHVLGALSAPANANLLDPGVWTKAPEPVLVDTAVYGASNICVVPDTVSSSDASRALLLYDALWMEDGHEQRSVFLKTISWTDDGQPVFCQPT
ncbi:MAG: glycoside hydrolase family 43 protein [Bacteroidaceae bacterium]|nr:glycoside hydrolase family 43 protein [Bacteroidaceae bacterium]